MKFKTKLLSSEVTSKDLWTRRKTLKTLSTSLALGPLGLANSFAAPREKDRDFIMNSLNDLGIACYSGSCSEIYKEKAFDKMFSNQKPSLKVAKELGETSLMFLVHPTILTKDGRRMSKSLGTGLNPLDLVDLYGADATRFSLLAQAGAVQDVRFDAEVKNNVVQSSSSAEMGRNFGNKVWNAARFVTMNMDGYEPGLAERGRGELADRWIWSRLAQTIAEVNLRMEAYRFSDVIRALYDFLWRDYCDWYLELAKGRLQADQPELRLPVQRNLVETLEIGLRLLHPVMPFMTESLWQALPKEGSSAESIVISSWPESLDGLIDLVAEQDMERVQEIVTAVRTVRSEMNVPPATKIPVIMSLPNTNGVDELEAIAPLVSGLVRASEITVGIAVNPPAASGSAVVGAVEVFIPLEGIIDLDVERGRLEKEVAKFEKLVKSMNGKLANEKFIANAPTDVVKKERERLAEYGDTLERLRDSLQRIS